MRRRIELPKAELERALIAADGFYLRAAKMLGLRRAIVYDRACDYDLCDLAARLRAATGWTGGNPNRTKRSERWTSRLDF